MAVFKLSEALSRFEGFPRTWATAGLLTIQS